jgi:hypothetical protein
MFNGSVLTTFYKLAVENSYGNRSYVPHKPFGFFLVLDVVRQIKKAVQTINC